MARKDQDQRRAEERREESTIREAGQTAGVTRDPGFGGMRGGGTGNPVSGVGTQPPPTDDDETAVDRNATGPAS